MAKVEVFKYKAAGVGDRSYNPEFFKLLHILYDEQTGAFTVEEELTPGSRVTRASGGEITTTYRITAGQKNTVYTPCVGGTLLEFYASTTFPYATITQTANSPFCTVATNPDDIFIQAEVTDETLPGENDGKVSATATSLKPIVIYSLGDGAPLSGASDWGGNLIGQNTTGVFNNLTPSTYWVSSRNSAGRIDFVKVVVNAASFADYTDYAILDTGSITLGDALQLKIRKKDYAGTTYTACMVGDEMKLNWQGTLNPFLFSYINGLSLDFNLKAESLRDWSILYTQDDREYLIELYRAGILLFRGYLLPEYYQAPYYPFSHQVNLTASDGMGQLKDYAFLKPNGDKFTGTYTLEQLITLCTNKVNINIPVYHYLTWGFGDNVAGDNILGLVTEQAEYFYELLGDSPKCSDVLTVILEAFAARISQVEGVFLIEQPYSDIPETFEAWSGGLKRTFTRVSLSSCSYETEDNVLLTTESDTGVWPGVQLQNLTETLLPTQGLVPNPQLKKAKTETSWYGWFLDGGLQVNPYRETKEPLDVNAVKTRSLDPSSTEYTNWAGAGVSVEPDYTYGITFKNLRYRRQDSLSILTLIPKLNREKSLLETTGGELSLLVFIRLQTQIIEGKNLATRIKIHLKGDNGVNYYLNEKFQWQNSATDLIYVISKNDIGKEQQFTITTAAMPQGTVTPPTAQPNSFTNVYVSVSEPFLYAEDSNGNIINGNQNDLLFKTTSIDSRIRGAATVKTTYYENVLILKAVQVTPLIGGVELDSKREYSYKNAGQYTTQQVSTTLRIGTHYYGKNNELFFPYAIRDSVTGNAITYWYDADENSYQLSEMLLREFVKARKIIRPFTDATLLGRFSFAQRLRVVVDNNLEYFCSSLSYNPITDRYQGRFVYAEGEYTLPFYRLNEDGTPKLREDGAIFRTFEGRTFDESLVTTIE